MSRTFAHVPQDVELARFKDVTALDVAHRHVTPRGPVTCSDPDAGCFASVPLWASRQRYAKDRTLKAERTSAVRDALRLSAKQFRGHGDVEVDVMPDPVTIWL